MRFGGALAYSRIARLPRIAPSPSPMGSLGGLGSPACDLAIEDTVPSDPIVQDPAGDVDLPPPKECFSMFKCVYLAWAIRVSWTDTPSVA